MPHGEVIIYFNRVVLSYLFDTHRYVIMASFVTFVLQIFLLVQLASAAVIRGEPSIASTKKRATVLAPTEDPFYTPPSNYETQKPGAILRSRSVETLGIEGVIPIQVKAAYQLLFRSTDSLGNPSAAVTTIIVPINANSSRLLSYQTAEDAAWANCAPSYTLQVGSDSNNSGTSGAETLLIIAALDQGWIVNVPDYEGTNAVYTSGIQAGQATLDSICAALSSESITGISPDASYQMLGYSGGSLASEWAAELQPSYAPELSFTGAAFGGLIPNVTSVLYTINNGPFAGLAATGIMGLSSGYLDLGAYIESELIPSKAAAFKSVLTQCLTQDASDFAFQNIFSSFKSGSAALQNEIPQTVINETGIMGQHGVPQMPVFIYKAVADEVSPVADTDALVTNLCAKGARIQYVRDGLGEHITEAITGAPDAFAFLMDRFDGVPVADSCSTTTVFSDVLDARAVLILGEVVVDALAAILQLPIGPATIANL